MYFMESIRSFFFSVAQLQEAMPTEEELKQFGAKPPEEAAPPPEARTHRKC